MYHYGTFSCIDDYDNQVLTVVESPTNFLDNINHHNSFTTLKRIIGYILRFINNCKKHLKIETLKVEFDNICTAKKSEKLKQYIVQNISLSASDLKNSEYTICKILQNIYGLENEMEKSFKALTPFKDNQNIIRVGGRLKNSHLPFDSKHPILLPKCFIVKLMIIQVHKDNYHAAPLTLLSIVRQKFWPVQGKRLCTQIFRECIRCFMMKPATITQLMGNLPSSRVVPIAPFAHTGVDYAGPFQIHYAIRGKRPTKCYLAVFICFVTKACHLELVTDLTTVAFLECLRRFISRRGCPLHIYSDNATNFVGAKEELKQLSKFLSDNNVVISDFAANKGFEWSTIPARTPHFGGLWESSVKRAKSYIKDLVQNSNLTFEQLNTIVIDVEAIINSRPITAMSDNPNDLKALTPAHFLSSGQFASLPEEDLRNSKNHLLTRYEQICKITQECWQRFSREYLSTLQSKAKWTKKCQMF